MSGHLIEADMNETGNRSHQMLGLWCAFIFSALIAVGWLGIAHF